MWGRYIPNEKISYEGYNALKIPLHSIKINNDAAANLDNYRDLQEILRMQKLAGIIPEVKVNNPNEKHYHINPDLLKYMDLEWDNHQLHPSVYDQVLDELEQEGKYDENTVNDLYILHGIYRYSSKDGYITQNNIENYLNANPDMWSDTGKDTIQSLIDDFVKYDVLLDNDLTEAEITRIQKLAGIISEIKIQNPGVYTLRDEFNKFDDEYTRDDVEDYLEDQDVTDAQNIADAWILFRSITLDNKTITKQQIIDFLLSEANIEDEYWIGTWDELVEFLKEQEIIY